MRLFGIVGASLDDSIPNTQLIYLRLLGHVPVNAEYDDLVVEVSVIEQLVESARGRHDVMISPEDESDQYTPPVTPQVVAPEPDHGKGKESEG